MSLRLPKGADLLTDIRRQGFRPCGSVFVLLDASRPRPKIYNDMPVTIEICIQPGESIDDLDFRCLVGLSVAVSVSSRDDRMRALLKAIQRVEPEFIGGAAFSENMIFAWHPARGWEFEYVE